MSKKNIANIGLLGLHTYTKHSIITSEAIEANSNLQRFIESGEVNNDKFKGLLKKLDKFANHRRIYKNLVVTGGRNIIRNAIGDDTFSGSTLINYGSLGDGTNGVVLADTQLNNETVRKTILNYDATVDHVIDVLTFWGLSEANAQHYEAGEFIGATAAANSGTLFARWQIDELKTASETLSVQSTYTLTQTT